VNGFVDMVKRPQLQALGEAIIFLRERYPGAPYPAIGWHDKNGRCGKFPATAGFEMGPSGAEVRQSVKICQMLALREGSA
jgi:hypothetical protein